MSPFSRFWTWLFNKPYLLLSITMASWAGNIVLGRGIAGHVPPIALAWIRWVGAFAVLIGFAWPYLKRDWPVIRRHMGILTVLSLCGITIYNTMAYWALQYTEALNGLLVQSSVPIQVAIIAFLLFRDRLTVTQMLGILASLIGVMTIITRGDLTALAEIRVNRGDVWFLAALGFYSLYSALLRRKPAIHWLSFLAFTIGWGAVMLTPAFLLEMAYDRAPRFDATTLATLAYVVFVPSVLAYFCFNRGVELIGSNRAAPFFHLIPVFGSALAILFLGERFQWFHAVGYAMVLAGVTIATRQAAPR